MLPDQSAARSTCSPVTASKFEGGVVVPSARPQVAHRPDPAKRSDVALASAATVTPGATTGTAGGGTETADAQLPLEAPGETPLAYSKPFRITEAVTLAATPEMRRRAAATGH